MFNLPGRTGPALTPGAALTACGRGETENVILILFFWGGGNGGMGTCFCGPWVVMGLAGVRMVVLDSCTVPASPPAPPLAESIPS